MMRYRRRAQAIGTDSAAALAVTSVRRLVAHDQRERGPWLATTLGVRGDASICVRTVAMRDQALLGAALAFTGRERISMRRQELVSESLSKAQSAGRLSDQGSYVGYGTVSPSESGLLWQPVPGDRLVMNYLDGSRRENAFARLAGDPVLRLRYDYDIEVTASEGVETAPLKSEPALRHDRTVLPIEREVIVIHEKLLETLWNRYCGPSRCHSVGRSGRGRQ